MHGIELRKPKSCSYVDNWAKILKNLSRDAIRNGCSAHKGTSDAKIMQVYHKSQEYAWSHIVKTGIEP